MNGGVETCLVSVVGFSRDMVGENCRVLQPVGGDVLVRDGVVLGACPLTGWVRVECGSARCGFLFFPADQVELFV